jgi:tight adherence protein B
MLSLLTGFALSLLVGGAVWMVFRFGIPATETWYLNRVAAAEAELRKAFSELFLLELSPRIFAHLVVCRVPLLASAAYLVTGGLPMAVLAGIGAYFAPKAILSRLRRKRMQAFDEQLVEALGLLANGARAGLGLVQALEEAATKLPAPASQEFGLLLREFQHGTPIERVLENARRRLGRPSFSIVATALMVNRDKGGNLIEVLDKICQSIREISRLEKKIRTETASVRFSAKLMSVMPAAIGIIFYFIEPSSMELLFTDFAGGVILFLVVLLNVMAMLIIQRIVSVEV